MSRIRAVGMATNLMKMIHLGFSLRSITSVINKSMFFRSPHADNFVVGIPKQDVNRRIKLHNKLVKFTTKGT